MTVKFSIVVCTYNRCELLRELLLSLLDQSANKDTYEIIVVDNNSTDATRLVVGEMSRNEKPIVRYVEEIQQGLSFARNTGAREATGEIIAYIDDDATAHRGWLKGFMEVYEKFPDAGVVGGRIKPVWLSEKPAWLTQNLEMSFGALNYGSEIQTLSFPKTPFGGNFSIKRDLFLAMGGFCRKLGRKGLRLISSEEVLLCRLVEQNKKQKIYYTPRAIVYHKVLPERLNRYYLIRRAYDQGKSNIILERELKQGKNISWLDDFHDLKEMIKGLIRHNLSGKYELLTEDLFTIIFILGKLRKRLK